MIHHNPTSVTEATTHLIIPPPDWGTHEIFWLTKIHSMEVRDARINHGNGNYSNQLKEDPMS